MIKSSVTLLLAVTLPLTAADHYITVDGNGFHPDTLQIVEGDTVTWTSEDELDFPHSIVSDLPNSHPDYWVGLVYGYGDVFSWTFTNTGTFTYSDTLDIGTGTIIVVPSLAPVPVSVSNPRIAAGKFLFDAAPLTGGSTNFLHTSTNLMDWTVVSTNLNTSATMTFTNEVSAEAAYFRVFELPVILSE